MAEEAMLGLIPECQLLMTILYDHRKCMLYWNSSLFVGKT